jgi:chaperone modulatory protein CbpM
MSRDDLFELLTGEIVDEDVELSLAELCRACQLPAERVFELVEHGVIEPVGPEPGLWRFQAISVRRVRSVQRLEQDLGVNLAGAALALDLLDELEVLRTRLARLDELDDQGGK